MTPFDFVNSITFDKQDRFEDPQAEKDYVPFIVNRALSYFPDTVLYANQMNINNLAPKQWQFDFLRHSISKRRRFAKWAKKEVAPDTVSLVSEYYKYSIAKTMEILPLLSPEQLEHIKQEMYKGGKL